jgi:hypothetical protein
VKLSNCQLVPDGALSMISRRGFYRFRSHSAGSQTVIGVLEKD